MKIGIFKLSKCPISSFPFKKCFLHTHTRGGPSPKKLKNGQNKNPRIVAGRSYCFVFISLCFSLSFSLQPKPRLCFGGDLCNVLLLGRGHQGKYHFRENRILSQSNFLIINYNIFSNLDN